jgi:4-hydroxy-2-oxoheptanedioate aldolase
MQIKKRLADNEYLLGTWCILPSPEVVDVVSKAGLDFIFIDMEHGPSDFVTVQRMITASQVHKCSAIVRVACNGEQEILKSLDLGADGILVPHIDSVKARQKALSYIKYPPQGERGYSPYTRAGSYHNEKNYTDNENKRILSGILVEGKDGISNFSSIIDDERLDMVYIGTYDISSFLGIPGETTNPKVIKILEDCASELREKGKYACCLFHDVKEMDFFRKIGIQLMAYKVDTAVLYDSFSILKRKKG